MATNNAINVPTAASGTVLQGQGVGSTPAFSTATYPSTATGTGTILRANGTNWVATTATYPTTTTANRLLYSSSNNVIGEITSAASKALVTDGSSVPSWGNVPISAGGTGASSFGTTNGIVKYDGSTLVTSSAALIDSNNIMNNSSQPLHARHMFNGLVNATGDGTVVTLTYDTADISQQITYSAGTFTVNKTGNYLVSVNLMCEGMGGSHTSAGLRIVATGRTVYMEWNPLASGNTKSCMSSNAIIPLNSSDTISATFFVSGSTKTISVSGVTGSDIRNYISIMMLC